MAIIKRVDSVKGTTAPKLVSGGAIPTSTLHARDLIFEPCPKLYAVEFVRLWHSRLPNTQNGPWSHAFAAYAGPITYATALWNNPSGRCLPQHWRELRRMACCNAAPRNTASRFLAWMVRWFAEHEPQCEKLISYQDTVVHTGTIYKAAGWTPEWTTVARVRDRSKPRVGTNRAYRKNINGVSVDAVSKIRWARTLAR